MYICMENYFKKNCYLSKAAEKHEFGIEKLLEAYTIIKFSLFCIHSLHSARRIMLFILVAYSFRINSLMFANSLRYALNRVPGNTTTKDAFISKMFDCIHFFLSGQKHRKTFGILFEKSFEIPYLFPRGIQVYKYEQIILNNLYEMHAIHKVLTLSA